MAFASTGSRLLAAGLVACSALGCDVTAPATTTIALAPPARATEPVGDDADDPAVWIDRNDPARSLIVGTNKTAAPAGALVVFDLFGRIRQTVDGLDRPNNVDLEYDWFDGEAAQDIVVTTERLQHRLRVYTIADRESPLVEIGQVPVLDGEAGERAEPMGVALYRRPTDGAIFAIVAPKTGDTTSYLWQYRLDPDGQGGVRGTLVRRFGAFSARGAAPGEIGEIEAVVVDDELGYVYYADERFGVRKWQADPDHPEAGRELAVLGLEGYEQDREGLAIYREPDGRGYLVSVDQIPGRSVLKFYSRNGRDGRPHDQSDVVYEIATTADDTDGLEVVSTPLPGFPRGIAVAMNSAGRNFQIFDWDAIAPNEP